ncbi:MAG: Zn-ribbon domain-containing OB-fold protein [Planctomycetes bacterium]|nr:Zn-ribbon domain-containing OB-fold protein [Planctomycetota bacterium]
MITARYWREMPQRYRYEAGKCVKCGYVAFPPRLICPVCKAREFQTVTLANTGKIETFTVIRVAPSDFEDEVPYAMAVIKLDDGVQVTAQVVDVDLDELKIGDRVRIEFRRISQDGEAGVIFYGYKFVPA